MQHANRAPLTSRQCLGLGHWLYPRKQSDAKCVAKTSREFRHRLGLVVFVVVADRGTVSAGRLRRSMANKTLTRAGRYKRVTTNLEVKEIATDGAERVQLKARHRRLQREERTG